ncbi:unnamed protein product [Microthlaspi erraticum]|uniref:Integrase zinc-binding domain-containing protein n=1 Tax=Microthlaspi erraticum TaxID=1685480 RepID=A0A6D2I2N9_9BRAS|nr:unnamed protein product [Microthlaspi erraticum]
MDDAQCKYATTEKELLAIVFAFEKFRSYIVGSKGVENGVADHLSRMRVEDMIPINDSMPEEQLMAIMILKESFDEKARLEEVKALRDENLPWHYYWDEPYLYKRGPDSIYRRCIAEEDVQGVLEHCHGSVYGGHFATFKTATKVLQSGLWWPTLFKDAADYIAKCDPCQRKGGITKRDEMPLNPILPVQERTRQHLQERGPDNIYRRCIAEEDVQGVLEHCHGSVYGGHFATFKTATKVLQSGLWWPTLFKDAADYIAKCDPCQRKGGITKTDEMPLNPILPVQD